MDGTSTAQHDTATGHAAYIAVMLNSAPGKVAVVDRCSRGVLQTDVDAFGAAMGAKSDTPPLPQPVMLSPAELVSRVAATTGPINYALVPMWEAELRYQLTPEDVRRAIALAGCALFTTSPSLTPLSRELVFDMDRTPALMAASTGMDQSCFTTYMPRDVALAASRAKFKNDIGAWERAVEEGVVNSKVKHVWDKYGTALRPQSLLKRSILRLPLETGISLVELKCGKTVAETRRRRRDMFAYTEEVTMPVGMVTSQASPVDYWAWADTMMGRGACGKDFHRVLEALPMDDTTGTISADDDLHRLSLERDGIRPPRVLMGFEYVVNATLTKVFLNEATALLFRNGGLKDDMCSDERTRFESLLHHYSTATAPVILAVRKATMELLTETVRPGFIEAWWVDERRSDSECFCSMNTSRFGRGTPFVNEVIARTVEVCKETGALPDPLLLKAELADAMVDTVDNSDVSENFLSLMVYLSGEDEGNYDLVWGRGWNMVRAMQNKLLRISDKLRAMHQKAMNAVERKRKADERVAEKQRKADERVVEKKRKADERLAEKKRKADEHASADGGKGKKNARK